jgi:mannosyl-3-phosphoglycerate phosphatase
VVVVSDLDGTLLTHDGYDPAAALPAIERLRAAGIPLVLASSKTRVEIEAWRTRLGVGDPFIVENGGALLWPVEADPPAPPDAAIAGSYARVVYGAPYPVLRESLPRLAAAVGVRLDGFGDVSPETVAAWTGLRGAALELARLREYDEPFRPERALTPAEEEALDRAAAELGLRVTRGGRLHHLIGPSSKARAMRDLRRGYEREGLVVLVAAGDGPNDLEMLAEADRAIVVARPDGSHHPALVAGVPEARFTSRIGPAGFAEGIAEILDATAGAPSGRAAASRAPKPGAGRPPRS